MPAKLDTTPKRLPSRAEIAKRAYELYLARGGAPGHDVDDWLQAEYDLMQLPIREIAKLDPPRETKSPAGKKSLVTLVRAAMYLY